jgi:hypothetical protein
MDSSNEEIVYSPALFWWLNARRKCGAEEPWWLLSGPRVTARHGGAEPEWPDVRKKKLRHQVRRYASGVCAIEDLWFHGD